MSGKTAGAGKTISDWIIALRKIGLEDIAQKFDSNKLEDNERLKKSGLPVFAEFIAPIREFNRDNNSLMNFLGKYNDFVVRAIPKTKDLPRRYKIGVKTFEECEEFLKENVKPENTSVYSVFLTERVESEWSGVILSGEKEIFIDIARAGLDSLSHGEVVPIGGRFAFHDFNHFRTMRYYNTDDARERETIWDSLQSITKGNDLLDSDQFPNLNLMRGYFEFVITLDKRIVFLDYKIKEGYSCGLS